MATISKTGIQDGLTSKAEHITRIIDALDGTATTEIIATGSFAGTITSASFAVTASYAENAGGGNKINLHFSTAEQTQMNDNSSYYFGNIGNARMSTDSSSAAGHQYVPVTGNIISANIRNVVATTLSSGELTTVQLYNATTNVSYSFGNTDPDKLEHSKTDNIVAKSFSIGTIPVTAADRIMFKLETPTFTTNPEGVSYFADVIIQES